jgi:amino acid adenylation domain-containing protein
MEQAKCSPEAPAMVTPERVPLTYGRLWRHVDEMVQTLQAMGIGRHDRVVMVLPNGAEMALAFLSVAAGATCAPLHPAYGRNEFDFYLTALQAKALMVQAGTDSPACDIARARGIGIIELSPVLGAEAGIFTLNGEIQTPATRHGEAQPDDVALLLPTSGTTSRPKMVPLTHANLCTSAYNTCVALELVESDRCLNVMPLFHSHGLMGTMLPSLMAGASMVCTSGFHATEFFACLAELHPTWYTAVPTIHQAILARAALHREIIARCPLRFVRSGSALLPPQVLAELERVFKAPVIVFYGMTEAASQITCNPLPPQQRKTGSVGVAAGPEVSIMDQAGKVLPAGEIGEIVVRGASVIQGYDNDPAANRGAFAHGWFRTGDQGYLDAEGYLFITGRMKEIINRGGEKIAPQEVDEVLLDHPAVAQAVTFAVPHARLGEDVVAAVVLRQNATATAYDLRQFTMTRLATFKVPSQVLVVDDIPKGPTGKLQRLGLAQKFGLTASERVLSEPGAHVVAPRSPMEEVLAGLWAQVLDVERVGVHDNFFQLGGDSILATQLISRVREGIHVEVSFLSFFEAPTVAGMASSIEAATRVAPELLVPPLHPVPRPGPLPLSYAQQRLWFLEQLGLSGHAYNLLDLIRLRGRLSVAALARSLQEIIRRHEILRTTFTSVAGQPFQVIRPAGPVPLPLVDLQELSADERQAQMYRRAREEAQRRFDLTQGPLVRATLLRLAPEEHVLCVAMHHIVSDGWSHRVFWREVAALYEAYATGEPVTLPELSIQYADFAHWQLQWMQGEVLESHLAYWKRQLVGVSTLQLPTDHPRPAVWTSRGARQPVALSGSLTQALKALSQRQGVTLFMTLLAALQTLLHRYTGQDDIPVGSLIANRNRVETEGLVGFFVNTVVLRTDLSGDPRFRELLDRVRVVTLEAYSHQDLPFEKLLEALRPPRDLSRSPLFQVLFVLQNTPRQVPELASLAVHSLEVDSQTAKFDVMLDVSETPEGLRGWFEYSTDLFDAATITRMGSHFQTLLEGIVAEPEQRLATLPLVTAGERQQLLVAWNPVDVASPDDRCIHEVFEAQVDRTPDAVAVVGADAFLSYRELNRRANRVAHHLRALGVGPEVLVGLCMERSLDMVVGLLGVLKAGGAYVPLDPAYPQERLAFMLADAHVSVLLTQEHLVAGLPEHGAAVVCLDSEWRAMAQHSDQNLLAGATADNAAYVLYTSGSTGRPKGVLGIHRAILHVLAWMCQASPFAKQEVCCQKTSLSFGDSIQELLAPLLQGIRVVLIPDAVLKDPRQFVDALATHQVTRMILVPALLRVLLDTSVDLESRLPRLKRWITSGENLSSELCQRFLEHLPPCRLINLYGASEVSDQATWYDTSGVSLERVSVPIGRPIANTQVYLLDRHLQPVPIGVPGELHIGGAGLTRGYLNRPELTAEKFIPHPCSNEPGARLYKTGDLGRYLPDGHIEFLGRIDHQIKLRGFRIELGEIEAALEHHPAIRQAVVLNRQETPGDTRLVAYLVADREVVPTVSALHHFLKQTLPDYMVPSAFVVLDALPLTPSGKIDRRALPTPAPTRPELAEAFVAPRSATEEVVAGIWATVLGVEQVGVHDNFFDLGGHSLMAVQVMSRLRHALQVEVPLRALFDVPTVAGLAQYIETAYQTEQGIPTSPIVPRPRTGEIPVSVIQEQLWNFDRLLPDTGLFNIPCTIRLTGRLDVVALEQSLNEIIRRHEILRTTFTTVDGRPVQTITPAARFSLRVEDLCAWPETEQEAEVQRLAEAEARYPFDLALGPLLRVRLLRVAEQEHVLLVSLHHIISDGWSIGVLAHELAVLYDALSAAKPSSLPPLPIQYADFAHWQRQWRHSEARDTQLAYWREQLRDPLSVLELPTDRPRTTALSFHTARHPLTLPKALSEAVIRLSRREGATLFMTLLAAFKMLLYGYTGQEDQRVATLTANRNRQEIEALIGLFINTVLLRTDLGGNPTFREVLQRVRATTLTAHAYQDLPFEDLVQALEHERGLQRRTLCQVMFILQNTMREPLQLPGLTLSLLEVDQSVVGAELTATTFDVMLILRDGPQGLAGSCIYKTTLFDATTITRMLGDFQHVLERVISQPELPLSTLHALWGKRG